MTSRYVPYFCASTAYLCLNLKVVVVVGGGYGGVIAAKELDATGQFNVVLIDRKDYFLHNLAGLRASVVSGTHIFNCEDKMLTYFLTRLACESNDSL